MNTPDLASIVVISGFSRIEAPTSAAPLICGLLRAPFVVRVLDGHC